MLCGTLSSCAVKTTSGGNDSGPGIAFPTPGGKGNDSKTKVPERKPDPDITKVETETEDNTKVSEEDTKKPEEEEVVFPADPAAVSGNSDANTQTDNGDAPESESENNPEEEQQGEQQNEQQDEQPEGEPLPESEDWMLILVNPWTYLPEDFDVELVNLSGGQKADKRVYPDLQKMMDDMRAADLKPYICSSYRTHAKQTTLYNNQINQYLGRGYNEADARVEAGKWVAIPGTSEHQTGLAFDIVAADYVVLDETQEKEPEQQWLMSNSWKYGFILRYPNGKTDITGIYYEPWHYRYVGKKAAKEIYELGITFEEYHERLGR